MFEKYPGEADMKTIRSHMFKFLYTGLQIHTDLRSKLGQSKTVEELREVAFEIKERRKDESAESKISWYHRHFKGMGLDPEKTNTYSLVPWDEQCSKDPLFEDGQPAKKKKKKKKSKSSGGSEIAITPTNMKRQRTDDSGELAANQEEKKQEKPD